VALDAPRPTGPLTSGSSAGRLAAIAAAAIPCLPFLPLLAAGETLWFRDFSLYFVPMKALLVDAWRTGALPVWDPHIRNGLPFLANPQTGVLYPPTALLVAFGLEPGLTLFLLLHLAAAGLGLHLFLRAAGFAPVAALTGGVAFGLGGYVASLVNVLNNLQAAAWIPWLLLFAVRLARAGGRSRGAWAGLAAAAALAILGGELQLAALGFALALAVPLALDRDAGAATPASSRARRLRAPAAAVLALAAAAAVCAVQLVPTLELVRESVRNAGLPFELAAQDSFEPRSLPTLAFPRPAVPGTATEGARLTGRMPWLLSAYAGLAVVWLAVAGVGRPRRRWSAFWCAAAVAGVVLALGRHSPAFELAYDLVPAFRSLRYPEKFLLLPALAAPSLAAAGVERLLAGRLTRARIAAGLAAVGGAAAAGLILPAAGGRVPAGAAGLSAMLVALGAGAVLVAALARRLAPERAAAILVAVVAVDLGLPARAVNPSVPWRFYDRPWASGVLASRGEDPRTFRVRASPPGADMEQVAVLPRARVFSNHYLFQQSLAPNLAQLHGWLQQDGGFGIETRDTAELIDLMREQDAEGTLRLLRLLSVRYLVTSLPVGSSAGERIAKHPELPIEVVKLGRALPRAYLAEEWEILPERPDALRRALAPDFPAARRVVLDRAPAAAAPRPAFVPRGPARIVSQAWERDRAGFEVRAPRPSMLVVTDTHYPGWEARVDGRPAPLLRANGYLRAVAVPPGLHRVEMRYRPRSLAIGGAVSAGSLLLVAAGFLAAGRHGRRGGRPERASADDASANGAAESMRSCEEELAVR
jgi:hypothetical protein